MADKNKPQWPLNFGPSYTPEEMLRAGVFEGKYINNIKGIPASWKKLPKVVGPKDPPDPSLNKYGVKSRMSLQDWEKRGFIMTDKNGWMEWWIKFFQGRRLGKEDEIQINRWRSFVARHMGQLKKNCQLNDQKCSPKQRQGLLQWSWDSSDLFTDKNIERNAKRMARLTKVSISEESIDRPIFLGW